MNYISHLTQFNPRSTLPSKLAKNAKTTNNGGSEKKQKFLVDSSFYQTPQPEQNSNTFFVRVSMQSLEDQKPIYKWRMNCSDNFVGITNIKLQSEGNYYNPNSLFKIELQISKSNFPQVKDLCLSKCIVMLKSTLNGVKILLQFFDPIIFTQKMIYITEDGEAKVWMDERFYVNPNNQLYSHKNKQVSLQQSLQSVISIFQFKCLKTKLSSKLFSILKNLGTIQGILRAIDSFENQQNLFPIQGLKNSLSTTLNTSCSLQFSANKSPKKRKQKQRKEINLNLSATKNFMQAKSMQLKPNKINLMKKKRDQQITYKSQQQGHQHQFHKNKNNQKFSTTTFLEVNPQKETKKSSSSLVISEIFDNNKPYTSEFLRAQNKYPIQNQYKINLFNEKNMEINLNKMRRSQSFEQPDEGSSQPQTPEQKQEHIKRQIIQKNGWKNDIGSLFDKRNVKQSFSEGTQQNIGVKQFKLKHLHTMGRQLTKSIMPVNQEQFDDY